MSDVATTLLAELATHGVVAARKGSTIALRPAQNVPADLLARVRQYKQALLALVPDYHAIYAEIAAGYGAHEDLEACSWFDAQGGHDVVWEIAALEGRCHELAAAGASGAEYRTAVELLVTRLDETRSLYDAAQAAEAAARVRR